MFARSRNLLLALLIGAVWLSSSGVLTLCVHDEHLGFEPSWALCCESASCCERASAPVTPSEHHHLTGHDDGCRDFALSQGSDWAPDDSPALPDRPLAPLERVSLSGHCPLARARALGVPPGVPPPVRAQRSPILRC